MRWKEKAWEVLSKDAPMYIFDLPQMKRDKDREFFKDEVRRYIKRIEELTGNTLTKEGLKDAIVLINNKRRALQRLNAFRTLENVPISGRDVLLITQIAFYDDPARFTQKLNELCDELDERVKNGVSVYPKDAPRVMLSGTPLSIPNWKLHQIIETQGAAVVGEEMCTGSRYFEKLVDESGETIEEMIDALTDRYMSGINCACYTPNDERIEDIIRLSKYFKADGVIDVNLKFCQIYDTEGIEVERRLKEENIPVLGIETDYSDNDAEQLKTRIGAFLELLKDA